MDKYIMKELIGKGNYGDVYLCQNKENGKFFASKKIRIQDLNKEELNKINNEINLLKSLNHPNIINYKDSFYEDNEYIHIIMDYCENGDLYNKIRENKGKIFNENLIFNWIAQLALGLHYLHNNKILHRDLKTQNIFLHEGRLIYGDFGVAKILKDYKDLATTYIGTPYYMSPEMYKYKPYKYKTDIWSLGCCIYEICCLKHPFVAHSVNGLAYKIINDNFNPIKSIYSTGLKELITQLLNKNYKLRPDINKIIHIPLIKEKIIIYITDMIKNNYLNKEMRESIRKQLFKLGIFQNLKNEFEDTNIIYEYFNIKPIYNPNTNNYETLENYKILAQMELEKEIENKKKLEINLKILKNKNQNKLFSHREKKNNYNNSLIMKTELYFNDHKFSPINFESKNKNSIKNYKDNEFNNNLNSSFGSYDDIEENVEEDDNLSINKISDVEKKIIIKTNKIQKIKENLQSLKTKLSNYKNNINNFEQDDNNFKDIEEEEENKSSNSNSQINESDFKYSDEMFENDSKLLSKTDNNEDNYTIYSEMQDKLKLLELKCIRIIGEKYKEAYELVKQNITIQNFGFKFGAKTIGLYYTIRQIIFIHDKLNNINFNIN